MAGDKKPKGGDSIKVFLRVRPRVQHEIANDHSCKNLTCDANDKTLVRIRDPRMGGAETVEKKFNFHGVFGPDSKQEDLFDAFAKDAVNDALDGYHGVMFVYGQTGSGKTFTMSHNEPGKEGMLQRSMKAVWDRVASDPDFDYDLSVSYVQLYNEMLSDMLDASDHNAVRLSGVADRRADVALVNDSTNKGISKPVHCYQDTIDMFEAGLERRISSSTSMNAVSSRSHTVFSLYIKKQAKTDAATAGGGVPKALEGRLVICDLAGSERIKKTDAKGAQLAEANHINGSLLVLGRVVAALTDPKTAQHVPYRESKLTRLLQYSLSGWGKTRLVVNVSPSDYNTEETLSAIGFGQRAIQIKQSAEKHETLDYKALYLELQRQLDKQRDEILRDAIQEHEEEKKRMKQDYEDRIEMLEGELSMMRSQLSASAVGGGSGAIGTELSHAATAIVEEVHRSQEERAAAAAAAGEHSMLSNSTVELSPSRALPENMSMEEFVMLLKDKMLRRDKRLAEAEQANHALREQLSDKEQHLLKVANKLRLYQAKNEGTRLQLLRENSELAEKLSAATGVEYLSVQKIDGADDGPAGAGRDSPRTASPVPSHADPSFGADDEHTDMLYAAVRKLQSKLNEAAAYNRSCRRAIKMLHSDLVTAEAEVARAHAGN